MRDNRIVPGLGGGVTAMVTEGGKELRRVELSFEEIKRSWKDLPAMISKKDAIVGRCMGGQFLNNDALKSMIVQSYRTGVKFFIGLEGNLGVSLNGWNCNMDRWKENAYSNCSAGDGQL